MERAVAIENPSNTNGIRFTSKEIYSCYQLRNQPGKY
jgi:hypothetical protein